MSIAIVNLTLLKLNEELKKFSEIHPESFYRRIIDDRDLCQELIVYVLNRLQNRFIVIPEEEVASLDIQFISTKESLEIENLIIQGIYQITNRHRIPEVQIVNLEYYSQNFSSN
ncbi:MAG TPA: hypothetical protein V6C85_05500 [Allocoleopsis sp.]